MVLTFKAQSTLNTRHSALTLNRNIYLKLKVNMKVHFYLTWLIRSGKTPTVAHLGRHVKSPRRSAHSKTIKLKQGVKLSQ